MDDTDYVKPDHPLVLTRALLADFLSIGGGKGRRALVYVLAGAALEGIGLSLMVPLLALIFDAGAVDGRLGALAAELFSLVRAVTPMARLVVLLGFFGVLMAIRALVIAARDITLFDVQRRFIETLRLQIADHLAAARWSYLAGLRHSRVTHLMSGDIQRLSIGVQLLLRGLTGAGLLLAQLTLAAFLSPMLAAVIVVLVAAGAIVLRPMLRRAWVLGGLWADSDLVLLNDTTQFLAGLKLAMSQNLERSFVEETKHTLESLGERQSHYSRRQVRQQGFMTAAASFAAASLILAGFGWFDVPPSVLITLLLLVSRMLSPVWHIVSGAQQFALVLAIFDRLQQLKAELKAASRGDVARSPAPPPEGRIVFEAVSLLHRQRGAVVEHGLRDFSIAIAPGEFLGVTGASGAGKTTFADLLVGLHSPQAGTIRVGGTLLEGAALIAWRDTLSYVSQDPFLFHDTVRRNLSWADPGATEEDYWQALALAGADELVRKMEKGLDTVVGERGILVSGGERQRIALARALVRRPRLLVLDEATGAIDADGEREIFLRLRRMPERPSIVMIAHRTENLDLCDRIVTFEAARPQLHAVSLGRVTR